MPPKHTPPDEFSASDRAALEHAREELKEAEHRAWLWQSLGRVSKWTLAVIAGTTIIVDAVIRLVKAWGPQ